MQGRYLRQPKQRKCVKCGNTFAGMTTGKYCVDCKYERMWEVKYGRPLTGELT